MPDDRTDDDERPAAPATPRRRAAAVCLAFLFVFLATRLSVLYFSPHIYFRGPEETQRGILADHLGRGLLMPFYMYQCDQYAGGGMIMGLLAYAPFRVLGENAFALKLGAVFFGLAFLVVGLATCARNFGAAAAVAFGLAFSFPPYSYVARASEVAGTHLPLITFAIAALALAYRLRTAGDSGTGAPAPLLGVVLGFGAYFSYDFAIFSLVLGTLVLASAARPWGLLRETALLAAGFAAGFAPWFAYHGAINPLAYASAFRVSVEQQPGAPVGGHWATVLLYNCTANFFRWFGPSWPGAVTFLAFAAAYVFLLRRSLGAAREIVGGLRGPRRRALPWTPRHRMVPVLLYVPVHLLLSTLFLVHQGRATLAHKYFHPMYVSYFLVVAVALSSLWTEGRRRAAAIGMLALLAAGTIGNARWFEQASPGLSLRKPGFGGRLLTQSLRGRYVFAMDDAALDAVLGSRAPGTAEHFTAGLGAGIAFLNGVNVDGHVRAARVAGDAAFRTFVEGLGAATVLDMSGAARRAERVRTLFPPEREPAFREGTELGARIFAATNEGKRRAPTRRR